MGQKLSSFKVPRYEYHNLNQFKQRKLFKQHKLYSDSNVLTTLNPSPFCMLLGSGAYLSHFCSTYFCQHFWFYRVMSTPQKLRLMTYLSPGVPIQVFELLLHYLEEVTGMEGYLITESRWSGPPAERRDPFTDDVADIGNVTLVIWHVTHSKHSVIHLKLNVTTWFYM